VYPTPADAETTAIVGSGPAGLSCAHFLNLFDHRSVIFDEKRTPGGLLSLGIPPFRLPRERLFSQIDDIVRRGSALSLGTHISDLDGLKEAGYRYILVATGAHQAKSLNVPGEDLHGVEYALDYLEEFCEREEVGERGRAMSARGKRVAVIGGGHTAFDAARAAIRDEAEQVTVYYRRGVEEISAYQDEIEFGIREGVRIVPLSLPVEFSGRDGRLSAVRLTKTELGPPDDEGRRDTVPVPGTEFEERCELVVRAIGQVLPDQPILSRFGRSSWGGVAADYQTGATSEPGVYAGGDCVLGASSVLRAIDSGKRAALAIDKDLGGPGRLPPELDVSIPRPFGLFNP
jgi:NADPH-dependent glutamate synthase beta subunit-like oxidoreductase